MQRQDDPFRLGGSITSSKLTDGMIITHLVVGVAIMIFMATFAWDWRILRGKTGCRPGTYIFYLGCRYLSMASIISTVVYLDAYPIVILEPISYLAQITGGLSVALTFSIFLIRIASMFKNAWLYAVLDVAQLAYWAVVGKVISEAPAVRHQTLGTQFAQTAFTLVLSTFCLVASLVYVLHTRRDEHGFNPRKLYGLFAKEGVFGFALVWAVTVLIAVVTFLDRDPTELSNFTVLFIGFAVASIIACQMFRQMLQAHDACPARLCVFSRVWRAISRYLCSKPPGAEPGNDLPEPDIEKRVPSPYNFCLRWLRKSQIDTGTREPRDPEAATESLPMTTTHSTASRPAPGRTHAPHACFANSRSTYAQTALYNSQDS